MLIGLGVALLKLTYGDEREIVDLVKQIDDSRVCFYPNESELSHRMLASLRGQTLSQRERPDFEDLAHSVLLESMIVDDHLRHGKKDATRAREGAILREFRDAGLSEMFPNASLTAIVDTGLPLEKDHSYQAYIAHFTSVVAKHARKTEAYRAERPGFDLGFLIFDESAAYWESLGAFGPPLRGRPHLHFADKAFVEALCDAGIDCVAWLTPYKLLNTDEGMHQLPELTIFDTSLLDHKTLRTYDPKRMMSTDT